jgi:hypothetical protein
VNAMAERSRRPIHLLRGSSERSSRDHDVGRPPSWGAGLAAVLPNRHNALKKP